MTEQAWVKKFKALTLLFVLQFKAEAGAEGVWRGTWEECVFMNHSFDWQEAVVYIIFDYACSYP
jgi:hypothetical protein